MHSLFSSGASEASGWINPRLDALNEADRELLLLHYWEDLAIDQIATLLGATANATAVRVSRAKKRFSEAFQKFESS